MDAEQKDEKLKIINFYSARAKPKYDFMEILEDGAPLPKENSSFLEAYNCERELPPKTFWMPAEKQIYRPDYVLHHFIHYPTVSKESMMSKKDTSDAGLSFRQRHNEEKMGHARFVNEITEATMIHTKAVVESELGPDRNKWLSKCKLVDCHFGIPFPEEDIKSKAKEDFKGGSKDSDGNIRNCWPNAAVTVWAEKLHETLEGLYASKNI